MSQEDGTCLKMRLIEYHDFKTLLGPCFVSFSIPLLVPGVVLTVVGSYGNEHTFARWGAWHVSGIVILSVAVVLLITGILLKCCYRPILSADIEQHLSPNPSVLSGAKSLGHDKDADENEVTGGLRGNGNRVSPLHKAGNHKVISTHDRRHPAPANGAVATSKHEQKTHNKTSDPDKIHTTKHSSSQDTRELESANTKSIHVKQEKHKRDRNKTDSENEYSEKRTRSKKFDELNERGPPPSYDEISETLSKPNTSSSTTAHKKSSSQVTGDTHAHGDTQLAAGATSQLPSGSSDANENSRFLPDEEKKKRRRKKRSKRRRSERSDAGADADASDATPRSVLPELRLRPVLLQEGEPHHHLHQHVHFVPEEAGGEAGQGEGQPEGGEDRTEGTCSVDQRATSREHKDVDVDGQ